MEAQVLKLPRKVDLAVQLGNSAKSKFGALIEMCAFDYVPAPGAD